MAIKFGLSAWQEYVPRDDPNAPIVLCFGDSWFQYPIPSIGNLSFNLLQFGKHQAIDIIALGSNGMEIVNPGKRLLADLQFFLQWESKTVDMIAISGGGNDFAGADDLAPLLKKGKNDNAASWFKTKETDELFANIMDGYQKLVYLRDTFCPTVPIVTHSYDYAHATGKGLFWFSPWIKPSFDKIGMPEYLHTDAVKYIIDHLAAVQESLSLSCQPYHFVNTRGLLGLSDWANTVDPSVKTIMHRV